MDGGQTGSSSGTSSQAQPSSSSSSSCEATSSAPHMKLSLKDSSSTKADDAQPAVALRTDGERSFMRSESRRPKTSVFKDVRRVMTETDSFSCCGNVALGCCWSHCCVCKKFFLLTSFNVTVSSLCTFRNVSKLLLAFKRTF